jgi:ankyrin repeat protein
MSPLEMAASAGDECLVAFLIGHGADVNRLGPAGFTPLCYVITISGHEGVVRLLLEAGADPDGRCGSVLAKVPPLVSAVMAGREEVVELLLKAGADPNLSGSGGSNHLSPLTAAAATDDPVNERIVKMLLRSGADMTRPDGDGITPLHAADRARHPELAVSPRSAKDAG